MFAHRVGTDSSYRQQLPSDGDLAATWRRPDGGLETLDRWPFGGDGDLTAADTSRRRRHGGTLGTLSCRKVSSEHFSTPKQPSGADGCRRLRVVDTLWGRECGVRECGTWRVWGSWDLGCAGPLGPGGLRGVLGLGLSSPSVFRGLYGFLSLFVVWGPRTPRQTPQAPRAPPNTPGPRSPTPSRPRTPAPPHTLPHRESTTRSHLQPVHL